MKALFGENETDADCDGGCVVVVVVDVVVVVVVVVGVTGAPETSQCFCTPWMGSPKVVLLQATGPVRTFVT
jgi:hypothetical protein